MPEWQNGLINWLGWKFEEWEDCYQCVSREIYEESGLIIQPSEWQKIARLYSEEFENHVLAYRYPWAESDAKSLEAEWVEWFNSSSLPANIVNNLSWLIPMCISSLENKGVDKFETKDRYYDINFLKRVEEK